MPIGFINFSSLYLIFKGLNLVVIIPNILDLNLLYAIDSVEVGRNVVEFAERMDVESDGAVYNGILSHGSKAVDRESQLVCDAINYVR